MGMEGCEIRVVKFELWEKVDWMTIMMPESIKYAKLPQSLFNQNLGQKPNKLYFEMFILCSWQQANELKSIHFTSYAMLATMLAMLSMHCKQCYFIYASYANNAILAMLCCASYAMLSKQC